eukprot:758684-Hanusia_phi.AAC.12
MAAGGVSDDLASLGIPVPVTPLSWVGEIELFLLRRNGIVAGQSGAETMGEHEAEMISDHTDTDGGNDEGVTVLNLQGCSGAVLSRIRVEISQESEESDCSICLAAICQGNFTAILPCSHRFHHQCVMRWLNQSRACPYCRARIAIVPEISTLKDSSSVSVCGQLIEQIITAQISVRLDQKR